MRKLKLNYRKTFILPMMAFPAILNVKKMFTLLVCMKKIAYIAWPLTIAYC